MNEEEAQLIQQPPKSNDSSTNPFIIAGVYLSSLVIVGGLVFSLTSYFNSSKYNILQTKSTILPAAIDDEYVDNLELLYTFSGVVNNFNQLDTSFTLEKQPAVLPKFIISENTQTSFNSGLNSSPYKNGDIAIGDRVKVRAVYNTKDKTWRIANIFISRNVPQGLNDQ